MRKLLVGSLFLLFVAYGYVQVIEKSNGKAFLIETENPYERNVYEFLLNVNLVLDKFENRFNQILESPEVYDQQYLLNYATDISEEMDHIKRWSSSHEDRLIQLQLRVISEIHDQFMIQLDYSEGKSNASSVVDVLQHHSVWSREALAFHMLFNTKSIAHFNLTLAFSWLNDAARKGSPRSQVIVALLQTSGIFKTFFSAMDSQMAMNYLENNVFYDDFYPYPQMAMMALGFHSFVGHGAVEKQCEEALGFLSNRAKEALDQVLGSGGEQMLEHNYLDEAWSNQLIKSSDEVTDGDTIEFYQAIADNPSDPRSSMAASRLGEIYFFGNENAGIDPNPNVAVNYFERAANGGHEQAMANLGIMLSNGIGVPQDLTRAFNYFQAGAEAGSALAMYGLGFTYMNGAGVDQNVTKAVEYFKKAADADLLEAHNHLGAIYLEGNGVEKNATRAFEHFQHAASKGGSQATYNLALMHMNGWGTERSCEHAALTFHHVNTHALEVSDFPFSLSRASDLYDAKDYDRAIVQYALLSQLGSVHALCNLAFILRESISSSSLFYWQRPVISSLTTIIGYDQIHRLYQLAALLGDRIGLRKLGDCARHGWSGTCRINTTEAHGNYSASAEAGDVEAMYNIAELYISVDKNASMARGFLTRCSETSFPGNIPCVVARWLYNL